jgi:maltose alpha-D-glucosyltransferase/alpha-amylase
MAAERKRQGETREMPETSETSEMSETVGADPLWYKDAVLYEVHVRAFADSDGDGMGDFKGLTARLDYLQELGVTAIWILPFYPSPWRDDGYDISDYTSIHPAYGNLKDFKVFLREAHRRGLKVITELVVNHTSDQHPWFKRARTSPPGSRFRNFYVWSDDPGKYADARIIFKDFETSNWTWDPVAKAYYWHRFFSHQPDLNFEDPRVHKALLDVLDFWMELGVDGLRLDAVPYLYEREGTNCENLPETHGFLKELRAHVDAEFSGRMLLAEANQWPEDSIAYFGNGDECHMAFHFPVMPRLFMAIRMEDRFPIVDILQQTPPIPESCQWATFLRNHDELTLEMVTDEDRDYMQRVYAKDPKARINLGIRRRLAPLLGNDRRRIELMNGLLFSLPGAPVLYYGDEIGMGDNIYLGDRNGVRTPMQWSGDRNAGFSRANPQQLYLPVVVDGAYHYEAVNVEAQQGNPHSLLWWTRRLIALRKRHRALSRGSLTFLQPENHRILAFLRRHGDETLLVVANLSRFAQPFELDLREFSGMSPVELFGATCFPPIGAGPYPLTLGPCGFLWFALERKQAPQRRLEVPVLPVDDTWDELLEEPGRTRLEAVLPGALAGYPWFGGKKRSPRAVRVREVLRFDERSDEDDGLRDAVFLLLAVEYAQGEPETYALPLVFVSGASGERAVRLRERQPLAIVAQVEGGDDGVLFDALADPEFASGLLAAIARRRRFRGEDGESELAALPTAVFREIADGGVGGMAGRAGRGTTGIVAAMPTPVAGETSNTVVAFGDRFVLKLFRRLDPGVNPELEIGRFLTEEAGFPHTPRVAGSLELRRERQEPATLAILQAFVPNEGDAWRFTLDALGRYVERALAEGGTRVPPLPHGSLLDLAERELAPAVREQMGTYVASAQLLGERTAELHLALASRPDRPGFEHEPFSLLYQRSLYESIRTAVSRHFNLLEQRLESFSKGPAAFARKVLAGRERLAERLSGLLVAKLSGVRTRTHGDYHLGQLLYTGRDFVLLDFEGDPARPLSERRMKRSPLRDVASMLRSLHCATVAAFDAEVERGVVQGPTLAALEGWLRHWERAASATFLGAYLARSRSGGAPYLPTERRELALLLDAFLLEKAVHELGFELNSGFNQRPDRIGIPLLGILEVLGEPA